MNYKLKKTFDRNGLILGIAFIVYTIAAINLVGYFHPDEHFQILEFANFKLGRVSEADLPWEFANKMRSSFQPWIAFLIIKILLVLKINNPYMQALCLRLITAYISIFSIRRFVRSYTPMIRRSLQGYYIFLSFFLWFLPFVNVRFSSESWAGILFLLAASYIPLGDKKIDTAISFKVGILCGLSFLCRYQSGFMFAGLLGWLFFIKKESIKHILTLLCIWVTLIAFGIILDRFFYNSWSITFLNYFNVNIIQNVASLFGTTTWYAFIIEMIYFLFIPIGIVITLSYIIFITEEKRSLILWITAPLLIIHLIISHKELRFMFPLANFLPFILIKSVEHVAVILRIATRIRQHFIKCIIGIFFILNMFLLGLSLFNAPAYGRIAITGIIFKKFTNEGQVNLYTRGGKEENPFDPYPGIKQSFYENPKLKIRTIANFNDLNRIQFDNDTLRLLIVRGYELEDPVVSSKIGELGLVKIATGIPNWIINVENMYYNDTKDNSYFIYGQINLAK